MRNDLKLAGLLLVGGAVLDTIAGFFHPFAADPNDHPAAFAGIAASRDWEAVHIAQFAAALVVVAGLIVLYQALAHTGAVNTLARLAVAGAVLTAAIQAVQYAVDGVALKQAADAWASAAPPERALAFHDAELARWLEWAATSYAQLIEGATLVLYGLAVARSAILPHWLGYLAVAGGLAYLIVGAIIGRDGFSGAVAPFGLVASLLTLIVAIGIAVVGWRAREPAPAPPVAPVH